MSKENYSRLATVKFKRKEKEKGKKTLYFSLKSNLSNEHLNWKTPWVRNRPQHLIWPG